MPLITANIFKPLIDVFEAVLVFIHDNLGFGWGLSIIALTVCVRALMIPLTLKQFRSMQAMQRLQPEIKKLQEKYKEDRQRLNQEMMKFYQENKVNPFASCLPLVLQMPVFLALFYMLRTDLRQDICGQTAKACAQIAGSTAEKFLFIPDLTGPAVGGVLIALLVLYIGSQLLSSVLMSVTADKNQRLIMLGLPFIFVLFVKNFPAGLLVYWITTNLWTVGQQYLVRRSVGPVQPIEAVAGASGGTVPVPTAAIAPSGKTDGGGGLFGSLVARATASAPSEDDAPAKTAAAPGRPGKKTAAVAAPPRTGPPPGSPRKKKKRSGRRR